MRQASKLTGQPGSRAQQVRQRRQQSPTTTRTTRGAEPLGRQTTRQATRQPASRSTPPVISRASRAAQVGNSTVRGVVAPRSRNNVRRQYYYSLSTPGAEVRLPSLPDVHFGWRALSAVLVLLLGTAIYGLLNSPQFQIGTPRLVGAQRLSLDDIDKVINVEGLPVIQANPRVMEDELRQAFPDLKSVAVSVSLPAKVVVTVKERQPLLAWNMNNNTQWVDQDGVAFPPRGDAGASLITVDAEAAPPAPLTLTPDAQATDNAASSQDTASAPSDSTSAKPVVKKPDPSAPFLSPDLIQAILEMGKQVPAGAPVAYSPRYGLGWTDPKGWKVYFGLEVKDIDLKLKEYQVIADQLASKGIQPSMISVEFLQAPFYRVEH
jgi:cell division protein FtsQ